MSRFPILKIFAISLALHGLVLWRLLPSLEWGMAGAVVGTTWLLLSGLLTPAPLMIRLAHLPARAGDALAWVGYLAMGLFSTLLVLTLLRDVATLPLLLWHSLYGIPNLEAWRHGSAIAVVGLALFVSVLGLFNARRLARVVDVDIAIRSLPKALQGFTIVQLSDIHIGPTIKRGFVESMVRRVNTLNADMVAITGDVIDGDIGQLRSHVAPLSGLRSRHGTFAVNGNHEHYHGVDAWMREWQRLGLRVLSNEGDVVQHDGEQLWIGGVTDYSSRHSNPQAAARTAAEVAVKILLAHQPRSAEAAAAAGFDVQLSGHTHGGQYWPWNLFVPLQQPFVAGLHRLRQLQIYVSRGTGYWGPPLRFGAPSEITRLRLVAA